MRFCGGKLSSENKNRKRLMIFVEDEQVPEHQGRGKAACVWNAEAWENENQLRGMDNES